MKILDPLAHCDVHSIGGEMTMGRKPVKSYNYFYYEFCSIWGMTETHAIEF